MRLGIVTGSGRFFDVHRLPDHLAAQVGLTQFSRGHRERISPGTPPLLTANLTGYGPSIRPASLHFCNACSFRFLEGPLQRACDSPDSFGGSFNLGCKSVRASFDEPHGQLE